MNRICTFEDKLAKLQYLQGCSIQDLTDEEIMEYMELRREVEKAWKEIKRMMKYTVGL